MNGFTFTKLVRHTAPSGYYAVCSVPTNLANWADQTVTGNLVAVNLGAAEVGVYFTRTNPIEGTDIQLSDEGYARVSLTTRTALKERLEAMKLLYVPGNEALLGMSTDFVPFDDMNYVTVITDGTSRDLDIFVQLLEQRALT